MQISGISEKRVVDNHSIRCIIPTNARSIAVPGEKPPDEAGSSPSQVLPELQQTCHMQLEPHKVYWLCNETVQRLVTLHKRVCEGKFVDEASEYARWLRFSGVLPIFDAFPSPPPLEVSRAKVEKLIGDVLWECEQFWKKNPRGPWVSLSELEAINQKLDTIAGQLSRLSLASQKVETPCVVEPALRVIEGGQGL